MIEGEVSKRGERDSESGGMRAWRDIAREKDGGLNKKNERLGL